MKERLTPAWAARLAWLAGLALVGTAGCASIQTTRTNRDTFVRNDVATEAVAGSLEYQVVATPRDTAIAIKVTHHELCDTSTTAVSRRTESVVREAGGTYKPWITGLFGAAAVGFGVYTFVDAERLAEEQMDPDAEGSLKTSGMTIVALGAALLAVAGVDAYRARDEELDRGEVRGESEVTRAVCHEDVAANASLQLSFRAARGVPAVTGTTDAEGVASISMMAVPSAAFASDELHLIASFEGGQYPVSLSDTETEVLVGALLAAPASKLAQEREATEIARCEALVTAADRPIGETTPESEIQRLTAAWASARTSCGTRWNAEDRLAAFHVRVEGSRQARADAACDHQIERATSLIKDANDDWDDGWITPEARLRAVIDEARPACVAAADGAARIAAITAQVDRYMARALAEEEAAAREEELAARREEARTKLQAVLRKNDAVAARKLISSDAAVRAVVASLTSAIRDLGTHWIKLATKGSARSSGMCAARSLVTEQLGGAAWSSLVTGVARSADSVAMAKAKRELDGCTP
jgi:hypothetical protein